MGCMYMIEPWPSRWGTKRRPWDPLPPVKKPTIQWKVRLAVYHALALNLFRFKFQVPYPKTLYPPGDPDPRAKFEGKDLQDILDSGIRKVEPLNSIFQRFEKNGDTLLLNRLRRKLWDKYGQLGRGGFFVRAMGSSLARNWFLAILMVYASAFPPTYLVDEEALKLAADQFEAQIWALSERFDAPTDSEAKVDDYLEVNVVPMFAAAAHAYDRYMLNHIEPNTIFTDDATKTDSHSLNRSRHWTHDGMTKGPGSPYIRVTAERIRKIERRMKDLKAQRRLRRLGYSPTL